MQLKEDFNPSEGSLSIREVSYIHVPVWHICCSCNVGPTFRESFEWHINLTGSSPPQWGTARQLVWTAVLYVKALEADYLLFDIMKLMVSERFSCIPCCDTNIFIFN